MIAGDELEAGFGVIAADGVTPKPAFCAIAALRDEALLSGRPSPPVRGTLPTPCRLFKKRKTDEPERAPVPFIVGVGRSGTTMLRLMLDAHPDLTIPPETHFVPDLIDAIQTGASREKAVATMTAVRQWGDLGIEPEEVLERWRELDEFAPGPALRSFYAIYTERQGKPRWGDKTPIYVKNMLPD